MYYIWEMSKIGSNNSMYSYLSIESLTLLRLLCKSPIKCI